MIAGTQNQDERIEPVKQPWLKLKRTRFVVASALLLLAFWYFQGSLQAWQSGAMAVSAKNVLIAQVEQGELVRDVAINGKVVAANAPALFASEAGQVNFLVKPGQTVLRGDVLAEITSPELDAYLKQQQAELAQLKLAATRGNLSDKEGLLDLERALDSAKVQLTAAKREKQRADLSYQKQVMSEVDYAKINDALDEAELYYSHAEKRVALSKERLAFERQTREYAVEKQALNLSEVERRKAALTITSPVNGVVGNWLVDDKAKVAANSALISVVDLSEYEAELSVPEYYADELGLGLQVQIKLGDSVMLGEIIAISPEITGNQVQVRASLSNSTNFSLRQNQRLNARIEFERKRNVLKLKRGAFVASSGGQFVYRINREGMAEKVPVSIGATSVDYVEVAGLNLGDSIIISDYDKFQQANQLLIEQL